VIWPVDFDTRLRSWRDLRKSAELHDLQQALEIINDWWWRCPISNHYLHWDDWPDWPDPWQLLADDVYCDLARALGIVYTIEIMDRADVTDCFLISDGDHNLVLVNSGKYILNWSPGEIVNIPLSETKRHRQIHSKQLSRKIG
jgi:hypothetical protein